MENACKIQSHFCVRFLIRDHRDPLPGGGRVVTYANASLSFGSAVFIPFRVESSYFITRKSDVAYTVTHWRARAPSYV